MTSTTITIDPDETLTRLRYALQVDDVAAARRDLADLDEWLSTGGYVPLAWAAPVVTGDVDLTGKTVAFDFDGVLHTYESGWTGVEPTDPPVPGAADFVRSLQARGARTVVMSCRATDVGGVEAIEAFLASNDFPPMEVTDQKVHADAYIDDRAVHHVPGTPWDTTLARVLALAGRKR